MFKIFTDGEREKILNLREVVEVKIHETANDGAAWLDIQGSNRLITSFALKGLAPKAKSAFLLALSLALNDRARAPEIIDLRMFVECTNNALKGGKDD